MQYLHFLHSSVAGPVPDLLSTGTRAESSLSSSKLSEKTTHSDTEEVTGDLIPDSPCSPTSFCSTTCTSGASEPMDFDHYVYTMKKELHRNIDEARDQIHTLLVRALAEIDEARLAAIEELSLHRNRC